MENIELGTYTVHLIKLQDYSQTQDVLGTLALVGKGGVFVNWNLNLIAWVTNIAKPKALPFIAQ